MEHKKKRLRKKIVKEVKITFDIRGYSMRIPVDIARNLKIEKGDLFKFITDRKRRFQTFEIIKKPKS